MIGATTKSREAPGRAGELAPWLLLTLTLAVWFTFLPAIRGGWVSWDDSENFLENPAFRGLNAAMLRWAWSTYHVGVYQPLAWMLYSAEYAVGGLAPAVYHVTSVALHVLNALALYALALELITATAGRPAAPADHLGATAGALLFAVHPLRAEVVAWASCQPYLLCSFFAMLAVLAYLRAERSDGRCRTAWRVAAFGAFTLAALSKAPAVMLPAILVVLDVWPLRRISPAHPARSFWTCAEKVPYVAVSLLLSWLAVLAKKDHGSLYPLADFGLLQRAGISCFGLTFYLEKTAAPFGLSAIYTISPIGALDSRSCAAAALLVCGVTAAVAGLARRWPGLAAAWVVYALALAPNLGLVRASDELAADRYAHVASIAWAVLLAHLIAVATGRLAVRSRKALGAGVAVLAGLALALAVLASRQCGVWRDSEALWSHAVAHGAATSVKALSNYGDALIERGRYAEAIPAYDRAVAVMEGALEGHRNNLGLQSLLGNALNNRAVAFGALGRPDEAEASYLRAIEHQSLAHGADPGQRQFHRLLGNHYYNLGLVLQDTGRHREAAAAFENARALRGALARRHPGDQRLRTELLVVEARLDELARKAPDGSKGRG